MDITLNVKGKSKILKLQGDFTIYAAADSKSELLAAVRDNPALHMDMTAVEEIDTSGVQLLLLMQREAKKTGHQLEITAASDAVKEVIHLFDLQAVLQLAA
jgi:anti-sigma B factor antagonist